MGELIPLGECKFRDSLDVAHEQIKAALPTLRELDRYSHHDDGDQEEINEALNKVLDVHTTLCNRRRRDRSA